MILERGRLPDVVGGSARRCAIYRRSKRSVADLRAELSEVEQTIREFTERSRILADELGARYTVFRCATRRYGGGRDLRRADLMALSRETDEYIEAIYFLEKRRKELLGMIDRSIG